VWRRFRADQSKASPRRELFGDGHGRFEVEHLDDVRVLTDQLACPGRQFLLRRLGRLPHVHRAPPLGSLVGKPPFAEQARHALEGGHRLVVEVASKLADVRQRVDEVPDHHTDDHQNGPRGS
jgi:hypothetical protein